MDQGFANIIADGIQKSNEANDRSLQNFSQGLGGFVNWNRQRKYNKGYKTLLEERAGYANKIPIIGDIDPEIKSKLNDVDNRIRNFEMIGETRGLRTGLTAKDYLNRDIMNWKAM